MTSPRYSSMRRIAGIIQVTQARRTITAPAPTNHAGTPTASAKSDENASPSGIAQDIKREESAVAAQDAVAVRGLRGEGARLGGEVEVLLARRRTLGSAAHVEPCRLAHALRRTGTQISLYAAPSSRTSLNESMRKPSSSQGTSASHSA